MKFGYHSSSIRAFYSWWFSFYTVHQPLARSQHFSLALPIHCHKFELKFIDTPRAKLSMGTWFRLFLDYARFTAFALICREPRLAKSQPSETKQSSQLDQTVTRSDSQLQSTFVTLANKRRHPDKTRLIWSTDLKSEPLHFPSRWLTHISSYDSVTSRRPSPYRYSPI